MDIKNVICSIFRTKVSFELRCYALNRTKHNYHTNRSHFGIILRGEKGPTKNHLKMCDQTIKSNVKDIDCLIKIYK